MVCDHHNQWMQRAARARDVGCRGHAVLAPEQNRAHARLVGEAGGVGAGRSICRPGPGTSRAAWMSQSRYLRLRRGSPERAWSPKRCSGLPASGPSRATRRSRVAETRRETGEDRPKQVRSLGLLACGAVRVWDPPLADRELRDRQVSNLLRPEAANQCMLADERLRRSRPVRCTLTASGQASPPAAVNACTKSPGATRLSRRPNAGATM